MKTYFRRKAVLSWLTKESCKDPISGIYGFVVLAYGAAKFAHNSRGSASSPLWTFRAMLAVLVTMVLVNEYNTSKRCSQCHSGVFMKKVHVPGEKGSLHGVLTCPLCRHKINRDVNSARNIAYCFWYQLTQGGNRPPGYSPAKGKLPVVRMRPKRLKQQKQKRAAAAGTESALGQSKRSRTGQTARQTKANRTGAASKGSNIAKRKRTECDSSDSGKHRLRTVISCQLTPSNATFSSDSDFGVGSGKQRLVELNARSKEPVAATGLRRSQRSKAAPQRRA